MIKKFFSSYFCSLNGSVLNVVHQLCQVFGIKFHSIKTPGLPSLEDLHFSVAVLKFACRSYKLTSDTHHVSILKEIFAWLTFSQVYLDSLAVGREQVFTGT